MKFLSHTVCLAIVVILFSCKIQIDDRSEKPDEPEDMPATVLWKTSAVTGSIIPMAERNGLVFYAATDIDGFRVVDAETGKVLREEKGYGSAVTRTAFFDNGKYSYIDGSKVYIFNEDFSLDKTVVLGGTDWYRSSQPVASGNTLFFSTVGHGFLSLDIESGIQKEGGEWVAHPVEIYPPQADPDGDGSVLWFPPVIHDGFLYSGVDTVWQDPGTFFSIRLSDGAVIWRMTGKYLDAWSSCPLIYHDGDLVVLDPYGFGIIDAVSGTLKVEHNVYYAGGKSAGGFIYKDRVYYTSSTTKSNSDNPYNVKCVDMYTGEKVWMADFPYSHGSNPVCYEGITYVFSQDCMRVLDAETGKQLAVDTGIHGDIWQECNVLAYKDTCIVKNGQDLFCVKMDFRTDGKGRVWQKK